MKVRYILYGLGEFFTDFFADGRIIKRLDEMGYSFCGRSDSFRNGEEIINDKVYSITPLPPENFIDKIVLSVGEGRVGEISSSLMEMGITRDKIISAKEFLNSAFCKGDFKYKLSIAVIVKDEERHILEWIEYHRMIGVEHFYIYDNGGSKALEKMLLPYISNGIVDLIDYPGVRMQLSAYDDTINNFKYQSKYIALIDADEFLVCKESNLYHLINNSLDIDNDKLSLLPLLPGGLVINWEVFGTSGFETDTSYGLLTATHLYRYSDSKIYPNAHIKTIVNPRTVDKPNVHNMKFLPYFGSRSLMGSFNVGSFFPDGVKEDRIRVYHYAYRSEKEIETKFLRGRAATRYDSQSEIENAILSAKEENKKYCNEVYDDWMVQYEPELKSRIKSAMSGKLL